MGGAEPSEIRRHSAGRRHPNELSGELLRDLPRVRANVAPERVTEGGVILANRDIPQAGTGQIRSFARPNRRGAERQEPQPRSPSQPMLESFFLFASLLESQIQINRFPLWGGRGLISACHYKVILTVSTVTCPLIYQGYTAANGDACWATMEQPLTHSGLGGGGGGGDIWRQTTAGSAKHPERRLRFGESRSVMMTNAAPCPPHPCSAEVSNSSVVPPPTVPLNLAF